jgi:hypothetical protein
VQSELPALLCSYRTAELVDISVALAVLEQLHAAGSRFSGFTGGGQAVSISSEISCRSHRKAAAPGYAV